MTKYNLRLCPNCKLNTQWLEFERTEYNLDQGERYVFVECCICHARFKRIWAFAGYEEVKQ